MDKKVVEEKDLEKVTGGIDEIKPDIKTLPGDNDEYQIKLTDTVSELIQKYEKEKSLSGNHAKGF